MLNKLTNKILTWIGSQPNDFSQLNRPHLNRAQAVFNAVTSITGLGFVKKKKVPHLLLQFI